MTRLQDFMHPRRTVFFWCFVTGILVAARYAEDFFLPLVELSLYLVWIELCLTGCKWCFAEDNWPSFLSAAWLLACTLGVWLPFAGFQVPSSPHFVWLLLAGYVSLRVGMLSAGGMPHLHEQAEKLFRVLSPECSAPVTHTYGLYAVGICSSLAICSIYLWFGSIPILSGNPELARYQHFNGPFTNNLFRFSFRIFSSLSLISSLYIIAVFHKKLRIHEILLSIFTVSFSSLCMIASGNRGDFSVIFLFLMTQFVFSFQRKKRILAGVLIFVITFSVFCVFTKYRNTDNLISLSIMFPEIGDAVLLLDAAKTHNVPFAWGKTYLAAALSFVPSALFPFRETYGFGRYALRIFQLGQDTPIAPSYGGLRPTFVGEAWCNGGTLGVLLFGVALGIFLGIWRCRSQSLKGLSGARVGFFLISLFSVMVSDFYGVLHGLVLTVVILWLLEKGSKKRPC